MPNDLHNATSTVHSRYNAKRPTYCHQYCPQSVQCQTTHTMPPVLSTVGTIPNKLHDTLVTPINAQFYNPNILWFWSSMLRHCRHPKGTYTNISLKYVAIHNINQTRVYKCLIFVLLFIFQCRKHQYIIPYSGKVFGSVMSEKCLSSETYTI